MISRGDAFLIPAPGSPTPPHLWIVLTEPDPHTFECVIVSVTTLRYGEDQTVILQRGDNSFIRHQSVVYYADAQIVNARRLEACVVAGAAQRHEECSADILKLVQDGVLASPFTPNKVHDFAQARLQ